MKKGCIEKGNSKRSTGDILKFLSVYILSALLLFLMRTTFGLVMAPYALTVAISLYSLAMLCLFGSGVFSSRGKMPEVSFRGKKRTILPCLFFAAGVVISIPFLYFGDYVATSSGTFYGTEVLFGENYAVSLIFTVIIPGVMAELFLRRSIDNVISPPYSGVLSYLLPSLFFAFYFLDVTLFIPLVIMSGIMKAVCWLANKTAVSVGCSVVLAGVLYLFTFMLSIDNDGVKNIGILGILGMIFTFSTVGITVLYISSGALRKKKPPFVEVVSVVILLILLFIVGLVLTAV